MMSMTMTEVITRDGEVVLRENNKRKSEQSNPIAKRFKTESPTTTFVDEESENLSDIAESESYDSSEPNDQPSTSNETTHKNDDKREIVVDSANTISNPQYGQLVNRREFRRAGPYIIGQRLGHSPVDSIVQYLARKENTQEFVQLKILMLNNNSATDKQMQDERQGKMLLHTEFSLLSLLKGEPGVVQQHGMFSDMALEEVTADNYSNNNFYTGHSRKRLILVLDCVTPHDFDPSSRAYVNLQQYLINRRKLTEMEALKIFYEIVSIVDNLHKRNIIHRDLKLGNIVLNKHSNKITIVNFCLGKYLLNENDLLYDQRGSPAYISPDVLCGKPYKGKPSDMWALGVVLFMMLNRQFPFFESTPTALFKKIKSAEYFIPLNCEISKDAEQIIRGLLQLNPDKRMTASQVRDRLKVLIEANSRVQDIDRRVPQMDDSDDAVPSLNYVRNDRVMVRQTILSASDQVVPVMTPVSEIQVKMANPRKRRRSTDQLFDEMSQRGISVEQIDRDADELNLNQTDQVRSLFEVNRRSRLEPPNATISQHPLPSFTQMTETSREQNRTQPRLSSLIRSLPSTLRITSRNRSDSSEISNRNAQLSFTSSARTWWDRSVSQARSGPASQSLYPPVPAALQIVHRIAQAPNRQNFVPNSTNPDAPTLNRRLTALTFPQFYRYIVSAHRQQPPDRQAQNNLQQLVRRVRRDRLNSQSQR